MNLATLLKLLQKNNVQIYESSDVKIIFKNSEPKHIQSYTGTAVQNQVEQKKDNEVDEETLYYSS